MPFARMLHNRFRRIGMVLGPFASSLLLTVLLQAADMEPNAAAVYCDCQYSGGRYDIESAPSIEGESLHRMVQHMASSGAPLRGLIRRTAIRQAGLVRSDELRGTASVFVWLAKLLRWGNFRRVAKSLYYRLDHLRSITSASRSVPDDRKRAVCVAGRAGLENRRANHASPARCLRAAA